MTGEDDPAKETRSHTLNAVHVITSSEFPASLIEYLLPRGFLWNPKIRGAYHCMCSAVSRLERSHRGAFSRRGAKVSGCMEVALRKSEQNKGLAVIARIGYVFL